MNSPDQDFIYKSTTFQQFFNSSPRSLVMKADAPKFTILAVSDQYLSLVHKRRDELLGKGLFEVFPGSQADPSEQFSVAGSFARIMQSRKPDELPLFKYEIPIPESGSYDTFYWSNLNEPLLDEDGKVAYIINTTTNITGRTKQQQALKEALAQIKSLQREQALSEELAIANRELLSINNILRDSQKELQLLNAEQEQRIESRTAELAMINKNLASLNEELAMANEELIDTQTTLQQMNEQLGESDKRFRQLIQEAPVAIFVLRDRNMVFETVNNLMYRMLGKSSDIIGKPYALALPELAGQPFVHLLDQVYRTGETYYGNEILATLEVGGQLTEGYFNFIYQPIKNESGQVTGIVCVAVNVADQVKSRMDVSDINERLNIAIDAGGLGYTEVDLTAGRMTCNETFKGFFGRKKEEEFTYPEMFEAMLPQYRAEVREKAVKAQIEGSLYRASYEVRWPDGSVHWISAHGRARYDSKGKANRMVGILTDITEQKADDERKNDFIGMVSHELKTPLTTINGYLQILLSKARKSGDQQSLGMFEKTSQQVAKMTTMINGFLNVSRLESGKIHIERQRFDMAELVKEVEEETLATVSSHKVVFAPVVETFVNADRDKIAHVISNLINNAVKYSPMESTIKVACITEKGMALFSVQDQGRGISPQDLPKLFERYYRVKDVQTTTIAGFGIGLYLCYEIIKRHEGDIWAQSEVEKGSTFYFSLPVVN